MTIAVAMSGGVDSSVAAALLRDEGHQVFGVTLKLRECHEARGSRSCCGVDGIARARAIAGQLGIPHYVVDCVREFDEHVLRPAWDAYSNGRTPSPCLPCNEHIKFGVLLSWARQLGVSRLATGHYARLTIDARGRPSLLRGQDPDKDQSYFLAGLTELQLGAVLFPVGHLRKQEVRDLARTMGLSNADARDSQDACLVGPDQSFAEMLLERFGGESRSGLIVDDEGHVLGRHPGIHHFTVGQRKGLLVPSTGRLWVKAIRAEDGAIVVTGDEGDLYEDHLVATGVSWLGEAPCERGTDCDVQVRYRHVAEAAHIEASGDGTVSVVFRRPVRAITPGQAAVFYDGARVLGRGWIQACC
ncbi:MAG: tRNA 2-thiouridine(34) synthase MnmA [Deltaproteobacteria bacterium]|nr:tRNA 2-thiouridine(34) synthase MnmA [Deltaproteobacteria bacterium]